MGVEKSLVPRRSFDERHLCGELNVFFLWRKEVKKLALKMHCHGINLKILLSMASIGNADDQ